MPDRYGDPTDDTPDELWAAEQRAEVRAMAVVNCGLCDDDGYRGSTVCDHVDRSDIVKRGIALVRAALKGGGL